MVTAARWVVILFGIFLIGVGFLMLISPKKAREYLRKAASTNFINYFEITISYDSCSSVVIYSDFTKFPEAFRILGWFMLGTSFVLYFVPRKIHHNYALWCAKILKPGYIRLTAPISFLFGSAIIYAVIYFG